MTAMRTATRSPLCWWPLQRTVQSHSTPMARSPTRQTPTITGADSFSYKAADGSLSSNVVTVSFTVDAVSLGPNLAHGVVANVGSSGWTTVTLGHTYTDMVVIATPNYDSERRSRCDADPERHRATVSTFASMQPVVPR